MHIEKALKKVDSTELNKLVKEEFLRSFSYITIALLLLFGILNVFTKFYAAVIIDGIGLVLYLFGLWLYDRSKNMNLAGVLYIFTSCLELFLQSIILEPNAIHNLFFFVPVSVFCFALFESKKLNLLATLFTTIVAVASYLVPRYFPTTIWTLNQFDKNLYMIMSIIGALFGSYKVGETVYRQKERAFEELRNANKKLEILNLKTKKLLQLIIHDISTPLTSIDLAMRLTSKGELPESERPKVHKVCDNAVVTIKEIIESAREMMALEDGKITTELIPSNLEVIISETISLFENAASKKNIKLVTEWNLSKGTKAQVDPKSFKFSVMSNLLANAIKFSQRESEVKIQVNEEKNTIVIKVIDQGIGIEPELIPTLFDPTFKTSRPGTEGESGTGYGLPLAKAFVLSYGGKIEVESEKNVGTKIKVIVNKTC